MPFLKGIQSGFIILIMLLIGYILAYKGIITETVGVALCKIVVNVSLPALMVVNIMSKLSIEEIQGYGMVAFLPFLTIFINYFAGKIIARVSNIPKTRRGTFSAIFGLSNTIFMGLPVSITLFGTESIPYALLYYLGNTTFFWTLGIGGIKKDGMASNDDKLSLFDKIKKIFSPPFLGYLVGVIFLYTKVSLPKFTIDTLTYLANISTPLSIFFIGSTIYNSEIRKIKIDWENLLALIGRFLVSPLTTYIVLSFFEVPPMMRNVFIIQSAMPAVTQAAITSKTYNENGEYASILIILTTIVSLILTPIFMMILSNI